MAKRKPKAKFSFFFSREKFTNFANRGFLPATFLVFIELNQPLFFFFFWAKIRPAPQKWDQKKASLEPLGGRGFFFFWPPFFFFLLGGTPFFLAPPKKKNNFQGKNNGFYLGGSKNLIWPPKIKMWFFLTAVPCFFIEKR